VTAAAAIAVIVVVVVNLLSRLTYFVKNKYTTTKTRNSTTRSSERPKSLSPQFQIRHGRRVCSSSYDNNKKYREKKYNTKRQDSVSSREKADFDYIFLVKLKLFLYFSYTVDIIH